MTKLRYTYLVIFIHIISQQISNEYLQCMHWCHRKEDYKYYDYCLHVGGEQRQTISRKPKLDNYQAKNKTKNNHKGSLIRECREQFHLEKKKITSLPEN